LGAVVSLLHAAAAVAAAVEKIAVQGIEAVGMD